MSSLPFFRLSFQQIVDLEKKSLEELFEMIVAEYSAYGNSCDIKKLYKAFQLGEKVHAHQKRETGVPYFTHPLISSLMMMEYQPQADIIIAMMLHDAVEDSKNPEDTAHQITSLFGEEVLYIVNGVSKIFSESNAGTAAGETLEKLFALAEKDVRILLVKLFDRLHNTITILGKKNKQKREKKLKETIRIYVPLAERLGLWSVKKKLEDAAMMGISQEEYCQALAFQEKSIPLQDSLESFFKKHSFNIPFRVEIKKYSISSLLKSKKENQYMRPEDTFFVRLVVPSKEDCYAFLEELSAVLPQKKSLFQDFIFKKKENQYQALHSVHIFHNEYAVTFHITSEQMQLRNDRGIFIDVKNHNYSLSLLHESDIHRYIKESEDFISFLSNEILLEKITVHGKDFGEKSLPKESRVIDVLLSAYPNQFHYFHSVTKNARPADISEPVEDHDILHFEFSKTISVHHGWRQFTSLVSTQKALDLYFANQAETIKIQKGKDMIQPLMDELRQGDANDLLDRFPNLKTQFSLEDTKDLFISLYEGKFYASDVLSSIAKEKSQTWRKWFSFLSPASISARIQFFSHVEGGICESPQLITRNASQSDVSVVSLGMHFSSERKILSGEALFQAQSAENILHLLEVLRGVPNFTFHVISPWRFWMKMVFGLLLLFGITATIFAFLFSSFALHYSEFLYAAVFLILLVNMGSYMFFTKYFSILRHQKVFWFGLIGGNILATGTFLFFFFQKGLDIFHVNFFLPLVVLLLSVAIPVFFYAKKESNKISTPSISLSEFKEKQKQKRIGYLLRFITVIIWGVEPILIRYSPFSVLPPFEKLFLYAVGAFITLFLLFIIKSLLNRDSFKNINFKIPFNRYFIFILFGFFFLNYLTFLSLLHTNGTNFLLLNNFAPTFALLVAYILWRKKILYLKNKTSALLILSVFILGGVGSSFLFYNDFLQGNFGSLLGNSFALLAIVFDALIVISQIQYTKFLEGNQSFFVNIYLFGMLFIGMLPFAISKIFIFPPSSLLWGLFTGGLIGIALMLNYETFKRMDGFIAYLMLNISVFITFIFEVFYLGTLTPTWLIILGGLLILGSSVAAEFINTHAEKKQVIAS